MSDTVIKVENLYKQYRLGVVGTGTLSHDLNRWWHKVRRKEDPYLKIGETNDRTTKGSSEYVWALDNINFNVKQGEVLGIIGKNGAGKSTLLKLLSRVTTPTKGKIKAKGRIASLLEVGTGFHEELTGRENIFLNGAILGMSKGEIKGKLDEIIAFSGTERYVDTPVKRYSSGMRVRLAFAVAAFLEPEILIVDEVLAVGDAEFQKKAIGKMKDVSKGEGRTVLFVSHNLTSIESLCSAGLLLEHGKVSEMGTVNEVISTYLHNNKFSNFLTEWALDAIDIPGNELVKITKVALEPNNGSDVIRVNDTFKIKFELFLTNQPLRINLSLVLKSNKEEVIFNSMSNILHIDSHFFYGECIIPGNLLNDQEYLVDIYVVENASSILFKKETIVSFKVEDIKRDIPWFGKWQGIIRPDLSFNIGKK